MTDIVTITGRHRFAKSMLAIERVRVHARWALAPAKKAIDRARHGETVEIVVPSPVDRDALMADLSTLGWSTRSGDVEVVAQAPEPPDWWHRVKGLARVVEHLPVENDQVRFRLALRDCTIEPEDTVGWVMHEDVVLSIGIDAASLEDGGPIAFAGPDAMENAEDDADFLRQLYPVGTDLEVFAPSRLDWRGEWRFIREKLWNAASHLGTELVDNPEGGSLQRYREYLEHNELGLAYDELVGLGEVNPTPEGFDEAMREAARRMERA